MTPIPAALARAKLAKLSPNPLQLWVVVHVRAHKTLLTSPERVRALREKMSTLRP